MEFNKNEIEKQVAKILATEPFRRAEKLGAFLEYIVQKYLKGEEKQIKAYSIAVDVFNRPVHFDPQTNTIVRVYGGKLRRELNNYYLNEGKNDPIVIHVPKGRYWPVVHPRNEQIADLDEVIFKGNSHTDIHKISFKPSIAVMLFKILSNHEDIDYLATGLTEEIIISLTRFQEFTIIGPLDSDIIRDQRLDATGIGKKYNVRFILSGTISKLGESIHLRVKLSDTKSSANIWGRSFHYQMKTSSIRDIEHDITSQVVGNIADSYGVIPRTLGSESLQYKTINLSEYESSLRTAHHFRVLTPESHKIAIESLESTLLRDPDNALALAQLGDLTAAIYQYGFENSPDILDEAEDMGRRAIALDPNCQHAHYTMALIHFLRFRRNQFLNEAEKALNLNPNHGLFLGGLSFHIAMSGEWEDGLKLNERAMKLNPHHPGWYHVVPFMNHYRHKQYDLALQEAMHFNTPGFYWDPLIRGAVLCQLNELSKGRKAIKELLELVPDFKHRGWDMVRRFAYQDENVEMLFAGLQKGGLEVQIEV